MEQPFIRAALLTDAEAVFNLLNAFVTSYNPDQAVFASNYPSIVKGAGTELLVAELDGRVVGYVLAADALTLFANGIVTELIELYVEERFRGQGVGRALVGEVVSNAQTRGAAEVTVPTRRAGAFYTVLGFETTAEFFKLRL